MDHLIRQLQAALAARDTAVERLKYTEEQLAAARATLDAELRANSDSGDIIDTMTEEARQAHIERAEKAIADARALEQNPFAYLQDNDAAAAGNTQGQTAE